MNLSKKLKNNIWKKVNLTYKRKNKTFEEKFECPEDRCLLWIMLPQWWNVQVKPIKFGFVWSIGAGLHEIKAQINLTLHALKNLWAKLLSFNKKKIKEWVDKLSWPVWVVKIWNVILENYGIWLFVAFGWMISLALAIFNILPIPALDWWRALSIIVQTALRLKPEKYFVVESYINVIFFVLLMWLWIYIILLDLYRFWGVNIPWF